MIPEIRGEGCPRTLGKIGKRQRSCAAGDDDEAKEDVRERNRTAISPTGLKSGGSPMHYERATLLEGGQIR
jgi:hypothetical protein